MINPNNTPVDIDEQREWLLSYKGTKGISWTAIAGQTGVPMGTLSSFGGGTYQGNTLRVATEIFKFRQTLEMQAERTAGLIEGPGFFETKTAARIRGLLIEAQRGRITLAATSPGTGKSITAREYAASASNVWLMTMLRSARTVNAMTLRVLRSMGVIAKGGWGGQLSELVMDRMQGRRGLLIVDEANHLNLDQFEEIRGWHDATGCGVCFLGNEELKMRISVGKRSDEFARLNSRIAQSHEQRLPLPEDVEAFCDAWQLTDLPMRELLMRIALTPAAGGLRECAQIVEQASMIAADEHRALSFADLREAKATRATKNIL